MQHNCHKLLQTTQTLAVSQILYFIVGMYQMAMFAAQPELDNIGIPLLTYGRKTL